MLSTVQATVQTFRISQKEFPDIHGKHNKANAFRHSLWNILIAKKCARFSKNQEAVLQWAKEITDWHEEFAPNAEIEKAMDLHNNLIGRNLYQLVSKKELTEIISFMIEQSEKAILIKDVSEIKSNLQQLVYLED